ncbi:MAG: hypothetical protein HC896_08355 [Bacteroidales bacterium]|nr:hypothetical protein [Bacteroidales bacterium]
MKLITIPRVRLNQLQSLAESSLEICRPLTEIQESTSKAAKSFEDFKQSMVKEGASADEKGELDLGRDKVVTGLVGAVNAELHYPHQDNGVKEALAKMAKTVNEYGLKIKNYRLPEETSAIDNLLADLNKLNLAALEGTGLLRWPMALAHANNLYKDADREYIADATVTKSSLSATNQAPILISELENVFLKLFSQIVVNPAEHLTKAYARLETLVGSYQ